MATANILKGAIASCEAARSGKADGNIRSLHALRTALQVPGHDNDFTARELEAHQLRKLQMFPQAGVAYQNLEVLAQALPDRRPALLATARAKRYRAEILQAQARVAQPNGIPLFNGAAAANAQLSPAIPGSALDILAGLAPLQDWDALEEGDTQYLAAFVAHNLNFPAMPAARLQDAETAYRRVLASRARFWDSRTKRHLRKKATEGLERVARARMQPPEFDWRWICP